MAPVLVEIIWPQGQMTQAQAGQDWLLAAASTGVTIPTGCLGGSCGACEIEVDGQTVRACVAKVPITKSHLVVELALDPHW